MSLTKQWSQCDCLSRRLLSQSPRQATAWLTFDVRLFVPTESQISEFADWIGLRFSWARANERARSRSRNADRLATDCVPRAGAAKTNQEFEAPRRVRRARPSLIDLVMAFRGCAALKGKPRHSVGNELEPKSVLDQATAVSDSPRNEKGV
jgi:hypothetical protein